MQLTAGHEVEPKRVRRLSLTCDLQETTSHCLYGCGYSSRVLTGGSDIDASLIVSTEIEVSLP